MNTRLLVVGYVPPSRDDENPNATTQYFGRTTVALEVDGDQKILMNFQMRIRKDGSKMLASFRTFRGRGQTTPFFETLASVQDPAWIEGLWSATEKWCSQNGIEFGKPVVKDKKEIIDLSEFIDIGERVNKVTNGEETVGNQKIEAV